MPDFGMIPVQGGFAAINSALSEVDRKDVRGIGISGQQHGFVPMDGDGQVDICHGMPSCNSCLCTPFSSHTERRLPSVIDSRNVAYYPKRQPRQCMAL